ncbi:MAG: aminomethyl-transferring glycine dehydrogenase subunit GcvPB [Anaerolineae bacterium]|jgi:glycine dehydrogenase subunit 2|nr:aminomethyl-transferring glycine dehydrogenase subunit GcvPB [Chloroflexota bacterium]
MTEPIIYELSVSGRSAAHLPALDVPPSPLPPAHLLRRELDLPEVSEPDLMRHYVRLSQLNYSVDTGMYPLGSCTMKYNPKVNEDAARIPSLLNVHPLQPAETAQGNLALMYGLQQALAEIGGFAGSSLQPAAGAQGELTGILMIRAWHRARGDTRRQVILVPDSAHGTNPASTSMAGLRAVEIRSDDRGNVDLEALAPHLNDQLAGIMLTNPNTLGLFDEHVCEVCRLVHEAGGLVYGDGANLNALMGIVKPAQLGIDVMHFNLHKTFSTPHGGGGPGAGPVGAGERLVDYLPGPIAVRKEGREGDQARYTLRMPAHSIGRMKAHYGHFAVLVRAYTYMRMLGAEGLRASSEAAVLNANYLQALLRGVFPLPHDRTCMHEFVLEGRLADAPGIRALDIAKRLMDYGYHPPTNYFPLIVPEALMIEPTETESKQELDRFASALRSIAEEARREPELLHNAPISAPVRRLDEVRAARDLVLSWTRPTRPAED